MQISKIVALLLIAGGVSLVAHQFYQKRNPVGLNLPREYRQVSSELQVISSIPRDQTGAYDLGDLALLDGSQAWAVGYDGKHTDRIYKSDDGGITWLAVDIPGTGFTLKALAFADAQHGWAVGGNGLMVRTTNAGVSWELLKPPTGSELHEVHFSNSKVGYVAGRTGILNRITREVNGSLEILCTSDGGDTWRQCYKENQPVSVFQITSISDSIAFAVVGGNRLLRTDRQGTNWREVLLPAKYVSAIAFALDGTGWLVGSQGSFLTSSDSGRTWQRPAALSQDFLNQDWWDVGFNDSGVGLAVGDNGSVALTTDNGRTWKIQDLHISDHLRSVRVRDSSAVVLGSQNAYVLRLPSR